MTLPANFANKIIVSDHIFKGTPCLDWTGCKNSRGYGCVSSGGKVCLAHRVAYESGVGPIPEGLTIDHRCVRKCCVNALHLEPVTLAENNRRAREGRPIRTHCARGHELVGANLRVQIRQNGYAERLCVECHRRSLREAYAKNLIRVGKKRQRASRYYEADRADIEAFMSTAKAADQLAIHPKTLIGLILSGALPAYDNGRSGQGRRYKIDERDVERFLQTRRTAA